MTRSAIRPLRIFLALVASAALALALVDGRSEWAIDKRETHP